MPIEVACQCGKKLAIPDKMAGKAVKCPSCAAVVRVPSSPAAPAARQAPAPASPAAAAPRAAVPQAAPSGGLDEIFDEEGFSKSVARVCPVCAAELPANAVLCTTCGYHAESGSKLEGHKTAGVDIDHGTLALMKAEKDLNSAKALQEKMERGTGLPWWGLGVVLFMLASGALIAAIAINSANQTDVNSEFNGVAMFCNLSGYAFLTISFGAFLAIVVYAFKQEQLQGILCLFPLYTLYYVFINFKKTWRYLFVWVVAFVVACVFFGIATSSSSSG